jgi:hypothetical protein
MINLASWLLPAAHRQRWVQEWVGELATLPHAWTRLCFAADVTLGAPTLALELRRPGRGGQL